LWATQCNPKGIGEHNDQFGWHAICVYKVARGGEKEDAEGTPSSTCSISRPLPRKGRAGSNPAPGHLQGMPLSIRERRSANRFEMQLPLIVRWTSGSVVNEAITESKDVGTHGIYFFLPKDIEKGSVIEIVMTLPDELTLADQLKVRCRGRVQRTESQPEEKVGVAVAIERYEFLRDDEKTV